jgi:starch-binding outer membrane protein, SusD/RagB family
MKKIVLHISTIVFLIFIYSCEDVLDKTPLDFISDDVVWDDPTLVNAYIIQVYSEMNILFRDVNGGSVSETDMLSLLTDEARDGYDWHTAHTRWKPGLLKETGGLLEWWGYPTIRKINEFLVNIKSSTIPESEKKIMIGKIKFARAFSYFAMVKRYGGIPIITVPQAIDAPDEELYVSRDKEVDVYDFIINELDEIADFLPESYSNSETGYPTKYAALALKNRAAMYAASIAQWGEVEIDGLVGITSNDAQRFWQLSYDASKAIIEYGNFKLYNKYQEDKAENFYRLFLDENNEEVIFSKQFTGISGIGNSWDAQTLPCQFSGTSGGVTNVYLEMVESFDNIDGTSGVLDRDKINSKTWNLADELFANKDPRFHASVFFEGSPWQGDKLENWSGLIKPDGEIITDGSYEGKSALGRNWISSNGDLATGFLVKKYCDDSKVNPVDFESSTDFIVFRYGEILLNYAEAAFELGKPEEALDAVNQIRARAGIALLTDISREKIRHERKVELAFEGHRYWDLKRWRTAVDAITRQFSGIETLYDANSYKFKIEFIDNVDAGSPASFDERHYYLPITPARIANNPNLAPENPGW